MAQTSKSFPSSKITNFQRDVCWIVTENIWSKSLYLLPSWTLDRILVWLSNRLFVVHKSWIDNEKRYVIYLLGSYKRVIKREAVYKGTNKDYLSEEKPSKSKMHCPQAQQVQARHLLAQISCRALNKPLVHCIHFLTAVDIPFSLLCFEKTNGHKSTVLLFVLNSFTMKLILHEERLLTRCTQYISLIDLHSKHPIKVIEVWCIFFLCYSIMFDKILGKVSKGPFICTSNIKIHLAIRKSSTETAALLY